MRKKQSTVLFIIFLLPLVIWCGMRIYASIQFDRSAGGNIKRAADANTVELAKKELETVLKYLDDNNITSGYTSVIYTTPDEDIEFWHKNLKSSLEKLNALSPQATQLEETNVLLKLRETLLDSGDKDRVTAPKGISIYPNNGLYAATGIFTLLFSLLSLFYLPKNTDLTPTEIYIFLVIAGIVILIILGK